MFTLLLKDTEIRKNVDDNLNEFSNSDSNSEINFRKKAKIGNYNKSLLIFVIGCKLTHSDLEMTKTGINSFFLV
jgi:hypothetical protein